jgi:hypothetical protein
MKKQFSTTVISSTLVTLAVILALALTFPGTGLCWGGWDGGGGSYGGYGGGGSYGTTVPKNNFTIMMNYELGMHCTGFEFSYCCVLPPYNSILAQVARTERLDAKPRLLKADPNVGLDFLGRPTVLRDLNLDSSGHFQKYVLRYWHDAQPRNDGRGAPQTSTLISHVEGNTLLMWNTRHDAAATDPTTNKLVYGSYDGQTNIVKGNGNFTDPEDNYANAWLNHFYIYGDLEGGNPTNTSLDKNKIRLGSRNLNSAVQFATVLPQNSGPAFHPMGPGSTAGLNNVLTFSGDKGTVVFTQMKVLENLPVMLTSPRIWEALGLPLDPFEDTINFFGDPGLVTEQSIRPFVQMKAQLHNFDPAQPGGIGTPVLQSGNPIIGLGAAPIDIPNCERCHSLGDGASVNSPQNGRPDVAAMVAGEIAFWNTYYNINVSAGDSDWYSRLKGAAISILAIHDRKHGTSFTANYPTTGAGTPQLIRLGHESVICQKCHADNVIAVVKSGNVGTATADNDPVGTLIPPITEAMHNNHSSRPFDDAKGRNGSCQGCHPAHRSDGIVDSNYPITTLGLNAFANGDNRDGTGGCYANRDVHANRNRAANLSAKPHMNAIGQWLVTNVANDTGTDKGIWCTNCHTQLSQEIWRKENVKDLVHSKPGDPGNVRAPKVGATLSDVAAAIGVTLSQATAWLDPKTTANAFAVWNDPGVQDYPDANVATIEILSNGSPKVTLDGDGDVSVRILDFCTTTDCVAAAQTVLNNEHNGSTAVAVPFAAATDGRDHWLAPGEPHCADCHAAPYTEQSGNINAFPPFNYPRKASLFRYSRGHQDITCQGCHESTHGLYPVVGNIDTTSYAQSAGLNTDGSHGPIKCGACHEVNSSGVPSFIQNIKFNGTSISSNFDAAVSWMHTFTNEADPTKDLCLNCHGDNSYKVTCDNSEWLQHSMKGRVSREQMDKVEIKLKGAVCGSTNPLTTVCLKCHGDNSSHVRCDGSTWSSHWGGSGDSWGSSDTWLAHLPEGRVSESVWINVSTQKTGGTCGY